MSNLLLNPYRFAPPAPVGPTITVGNSWTLDNGSAIAKAVIAPVSSGSAMLLYSIAGQSGYWRPIDWSSPNWIVGTRQNGLGGNSQAVVANSSSTVMHAGIGGGNVYARPMSRTGSWGFTQGILASLGADSTKVDLANLSSTHNVVVCSNGTSGKLYDLVLAGNWVGAVAGTAWDTGLASSSIPSCAAMSGTQLLIAYKKSSVGMVMLDEYASYTWTPAAQGPISFIGSNVDLLKIRPVSSTVALVAYTVGGGMYVCPIGLSGSTISAGSPVTMSSTATTDSLELLPVSSTVALIFWRDSGNNNGIVCPIVWTGAAWQKGTEVIYDATGWYPAAALMSPTTVLMVHNHTALPYSLVRELTLS